MPNIHLLTLIHGMWGNPGHLAELARTIREVYSEPAADGTQLHVLLAETNSEESTYDGIDWGGERVAQEIVDEIAKLEADGHSVTRFSVTGYSLGGLVARYVIGVLNQKKFFESITPVTFNTIATPHIGLPRFPTFMSGLASSLGPKLLSRTGEQFYCVDKWSAKGRPLIEVMADPDRIFYQALKLFETRRIYANGVHDVTVPFVTAAIETYDPFVDAKTKGLDIEFYPGTEHLIKSFSQPATPPPQQAKPSVLSRKYWKRSKRPMLPPFLQFRFPLNIILYASLPLLVPLVMSLAIFRLSMASRSSRSRIKLLEKEQSSETLMSALLALEHSVEHAVVDMMETDSTPVDPEQASEEQPIITQLQRQIARNLNMLPIEKVVAYFPDVRNSHAMIISRDVKRFPAHKAGEAVIKHWASMFVL